MADITTADAKRSSHAGDYSEAPTIAPSRGSYEKETNAPSERADSASRTSIHDAPTATESASAEKQHELEKTATAASQAPGETLQPTATREDGTEYPSGLRLGLITLALCLSVFLIALDNSIIATAIPKITDQFQSLGDVGWYGSAYLLTTAALQLLFGKFYSFFSIKWVYLIAIFIFEVGSLICGVANTSTTLIIGRAVAGLGSAGVFSGALIILAYSVPLNKRPIYSGMIASMYGIASVAGPLMGGAFTDKITWRWCFYINLPIGAVTLVVITLFFPDPDRSSIPGTPQAADQTFKEKFWQFDPIGTAIFMPAIICLLLALQWGGTKYPWSDGRIIAMLVLFGVLIVIFLFVQYKQQDRATVPPRLIKMRSVWSSAFYSFCIGASFLSAMYFLPIWFQAVKGASAVQSGLMNLPMLISCVVISIFAGAAVTIWGYYAPFMILGTVLLSVGYGLLSTFQPDTGSGHWIGFQILAGAGVGLGMQQPLMAVQTVLNISDVPTGTAIIIFLQTLGGALFVSISENIFTNKLVDYLLVDAPGVDPRLVLATGATSIQSAIPPELLPGVTQAYNDALTKTFLLSAALGAATILGSAFIEWRSVKGQKPQVGMA